MEKIVRILAPYNLQKEIEEDTHRFRVVSCGRRWGKSLMAMREAFNMLVHRYIKTGRKQRGWVIAPTFPLVREDWLIAEELLKDAITRKQQTAMRMDFGPIGFLEFKSAEREDEGLRGAGLDCAVVDEASRVSKKSWEYGIRPSLADKQGRAIFISTPRGRNWFYEMWLQGKDSHDTKSWQHPTKTNPYFPKEEWEVIRLKTPKKVFEQEYMAEFLEDEASVFSNLSSCLRGHLEEPIEGKDYIFGWDLARTEDFTVGIGIRKDTRQVVYFSRHRETDWSLQKKLIKDVLKRYNNAKGLIDSTGVGDPIEQDLRKAGCRVEGFKFNNTSKQELIEQLIVAIEQGLIGIPPEQILIDEVKAFGYEILPSGRIRYSAPEGLHDDCVISLGLAVWGIRHALYDKPKKSEEKREYEGSWKQAYDRLKKYNKLRRMPENNQFSQTELYEYMEA